MKLMKIGVCLACLCACVCSMSGCAKSGGGSRDGLVKAEGVVMYQGAPVVEATIEMRPTDESITNCVAVGRTDAEGKFSMMTDRPGDGAVPGQYRVVVKKQVEMIDGVTREEYVKNKAADGAKDVQFDKSKLKTENLLPAKYADPLNSPLTVDIPAKGDKNITITLED